MAQLKNETEYRKMMERIDELLKVVDDDTPIDDMNYIELDIISDLVEEYEDAHYPIGLAETKRTAWAGIPAAAEFPHLHP